MEKRVIFWGGFVILLLITLTETPLLSSLFALLVLGLIPGTDLVIPAWIILILYPALGMLGIHWLRTQPLFIGEQTKPVKPVARRSALKQLKQKSTKVAIRTKKRAHAAKHRPRAAV